MDYFVIASLFMIIAGAAIMAINIIKSIATLRVYLQVVREETGNVRKIFKIHEVLMSFFLVGYIAVAFAIITQIDLISDLFVGIIFFFGAVFVQLGIFLQKKMILSIKNQYDKAISIHNALKKEQQILEATNENLSEEIRHRKEAQQEQKRLELKLIRSEKMEALGLLAGGVAHDLNNVLSGIVSYPDLILMELEDDSPLRKPILTMQSSGKKAAEIVHDLLALARRGVIDRSIVNINDIIQKYIDSPEYEKLQKHHPNVRVSTDLGNELPNIEGSFIQLKKVVMNLMTNGAESQPDGGRISISTFRRFVEIPISGFEEIEAGDYVVLEVRDTGSGIAENDIPNIFEPFYTKKKMGRSGSGLGMPIVYGTVHDYNGYIDLNSIEGVGTSFSIYLPAQYEEKTKKEKPVPVEEYMGNRETILVVDDIKEQRHIAETILQKLNYTVTTAASGEEACDYLKNNTVDLVILDMIMEHGIDGLDTYREIITFHPGQKAVIASGYSETDRIREAQRLGVGEYIKKPYSFEKLGIAIKTELKKT